MDAGESAGEGAAIGCRALQSCGVGATDQRCDRAGDADDELVLGHRDAEWTGHAPILEEDIAISNIAQDEIGHALVWYTALEKLGCGSPDALAFERPAAAFTCARFVTYPKGDFAYTIVRQFFFDVAEELRLRSFADGSEEILRAPALKILKEEAYHRLHSQGLVERLGSATEESSRRMRAAVDAVRAGARDRSRVEADLVAALVAAPGVDLDYAEVLRGAYPGREIVLVDAREIFARGGGIHCITQQQPRARS